MYKTMKKFILLILILFLLTACGKKGPVVPPESLAPAPVNTLKVEQKGERFHVTWKAPAQDLAGRPLKDLAGFRVYRREVLPPGQDCEECPDAYRLLRTVDLEYPRDARVSGDLYIHTDSEIDSGTTYQYKVVSFRRDGRVSDVSNRVRREKVSSPPALVLRATSTPTSIVLQWQAPQLAADQQLVGYNVYRRKADAGPTQLLTPVPFKENRFEDLQLARGTGYVYTVRCVAAIGAYEVEGELSNEAAGELAEPE